MVSYKQIEFNLRRTADKGLMSLLHQSQLEKLALKYFGIKDEEGNYIAYQCPYSGKVTNYNDLILEHIIPVASKGGTVLFNCIPTSSEVNGSDEKGTKHLIEWWTNSKYWDNNAPQRLEKLVNYMLEAYDQVFDEYTIEELEDSYLDIIGEVEESDYEQEDNLSYSELNEYKEELEQAKTNKIYSYLGFLNDCINQLKEENINVDEIHIHLKQLQEKKVFENIEQFTKVQNITKEIVIKILGDDNRGYLTYSLNIDINKLMKSIPYINEKEMYNEITYRLININSMLIEKGLSITDYFKNLRDIEEINLLYKDINEISKDEKEAFIESISLGHDSKVNIFIEMLRHASTTKEIEELLKQGSQVLFTTYIKDDNNNYIVDKVYENSPVGQFWSGNKAKLKSIIESDEELRDKLDDYYFNTRGGQISVDGNERRINVFIEMLRHAQNAEKIAELLKQGSQVLFTTYTKDGNNNYIVDKVYENSPVGHFWTGNKAKLKSIIESDKELRDKLNNYYFNTLSGQMSEEGQQIRIEVFLEMLKMAKTEGEIANLLKKNSQVPFTTYKTDENGEYVIDNTYRTLSDYWNANKSRIKPLIEQDNELKNKLDNYYFNTLSGQTSDDGRQRRIEVFLEMLEMAETNDEIANMLKFNSQVPFTTYKIDENGKKIIDKKYDSLGGFWNIKPRRKKIYRIVKNNLDKYSKVQEAFDSFLLGNDTCGGESSDRKIEVFIDMLEHGNSNILIYRTDEKFTTYKTDENGKDYAYKTYGNIGQFWYKTNNRKKIYSILNSNPHKYANSFETINTYLLDSNNRSVDSINRRIEVFLEMLNHGNSKILSQKNKEQYTIYGSYDEETDNNYTIKKYGNVGQFWSKDFNRKKVLKIILENPQKYENAIQTIIKYYKVKSLEEYLELERKKEELKKLKKLKKQSELVSNQIDIKNDNYRKAI